MSLPTETEHDSFDATISPDRDAIVTMTADEYQDLIDARDAFAVAHAQKSPVGTHARPCSSRRC